jgi:soluble lytic murein transglycosylase-like protein
MSIAPIAAPTVENGSVEGPAGPAAAAQRIQQLQDLIAKVQAGPAGFAASLQAAQTARQTGPAQPGTPRVSTLPTSTLAASTPGSTLPASMLPASTLPASTVRAPSGGGETSSAYDALVEQAAARNGVDPAVLHGLVQQESGFDPSSTSSAGALGLTQLMPGTAASLGVTNPLDPAQSIEGGARYLGEMLRQFGGNTEDALAAYNAGPGAVQRYGGVPPYSETQQYVTKVLGYAAEYRSSHPGAVASPQAAIA